MGDSMKYKVAIVVPVFDLHQVSSRGVGVLLRNFSKALAKASICDVYCMYTPHWECPGFNKITKITEDDIQNPDFLRDSEYDFIFGDYDKKKYYYNSELRHSHSPMYREAVVRTPFEMLVKKIFDKSRLVTKAQKEEYLKNIAHLDIMLANSVIARNDYIEFGGISPEKVYVATPGINVVDDFSYTPNSVCTFGISAVTFALKGGYTFLHALYRLKKYSDNFKAKIVYPSFKKNSVLDWYIRLLGLHNHVEFLPFQGDMTKFYQSIDCLVSPSREDTFGLVVLEAMANSRPVIISNRCGAVDIINEGENGWVFEYNNKTDDNLAGKLKYFVQNYKNLSEIAKNSYETAKKYNLDFYAEQLQNIFAEAKKKKSV